MARAHSGNREWYPGIDRHLATLACPRCRGVLVANANRVGCDRCCVDFVDADGQLDFMADAGRPGLAGRFMESKTVARMAEALFRPAFTRLGSRARYADEVKYLTKWLAPVDGPALDLACGTGRYTRWLAERLGADRVVGLDVSAAMLARARAAAAQSNLRDLVFVRASALSLPIADGTLGAVHCFGALHLFPSSDQALHEVRRTLRSGGSFTCLTACYAERALTQSAQSAFSRVASTRSFAVGELEASLARMEFDLLDATTAGMLLMFAAQRR